MREMLKGFAVPVFGALVVLVFFLFGAFSGGFSRAQPPVGGSPEKTIPISIHNKQFKAFVADTPTLRERGLGGRESLAPDEAMLFVFDSAAPHGFWMKDMLFPIDMVWVGDGGAVVDIKENISPASYPEIFVPRVSARFVLEAAAGFAERNNVKIGDKLSW